MTGKSFAILMIGAVCAILTVGCSSMSGGNYAENGTKASFRGVATAGQQNNAVESEDGNSQGPRNAEGPRERFVEFSSARESRVK